jgi:hypothetical protein
MALKKKIRIAILTIMAILLLSGIIMAATYYQTTVNSYTFINEHSVFKKVTNNCSNAIFIPTNTAAEWSSFYTNNPSCTTVEEAKSVPIYKQLSNPCVITGTGSGNGAVNVSIGGYATWSVYCNTGYEACLQRTCYGASCVSCPAKTLVATRTWNVTCYVNNNSVSDFKYWSMGTGCV